MANSRPILITIITTNVTKTNTISLKCRVFTTGLCATEYVYSVVIVLLPEREFTWFI